MKITKFLENVGNTSTTAYLGSRKLGDNVNVAAYENTQGRIVLVLESNGVKVKGVETIIVDWVTYECFKDDVTAKPLFVRAIELFGATTYFARGEEQ